MASQKGAPFWEVVMKSLQLSSTKGGVLGTTGKTSGPIAGLNLS